MTATIIPFPVPGPVRSGTPAAAAGTPPGAEAVLPPSPPPHGAPPVATSRFPAVPRWPERSAPAGVLGATSTPARGAPYLGPCRRIKGQRTTGAPLATAAVPGPLPATGEPDRLVRALEGLRTALAQQARTVAAWRVSLATLEGAVGSLQLGLTRQSGSMQELEAQVSRLGTPAGLQAPPTPR